MIRLLSPEDYGTMALAMMFINVIGPVSELGLGAALIQRREIDDVVIRKTFGLILIVSTSVALALALASPSIAALFESPQLRTIIPVLSIGIVFLSLAVVPRSLLQRSLHFKAQSIVDTISAIVGGLVALALALSGFGVWSLVLSFLATTAMRALGLIVSSRFFVLPSLDLRGTGEIVSFGSWLTLTHLTWLMWTQADVFIIGKLLGGERLGYYSVAKHIAELPQAKIQGIINQVAFPAYSKALSEDGDPSYYLEKYLRLSSVVAFPVFVGLSAVAPEFVHIVLGEKWIAAILPLQLLTLGMPWRGLEAAFSPYLHALGKVKTSFLNMVLGFAVMVAALVVGSNGGLTGISAAWSISGALIFLIVLARSARVTDIQVMRTLVLVARVGIPSVVMYLALFAVRSVALSDSNLVVNLVVLVVFGILSYLASVRMFCRREWNEMMGMFKTTQQQPENPR